jgi:predicted O-methyltransferase YrrM
MFCEKTEEILHNLEQTAKDFWNIDRESANFLNMLIKALNVKNALELGTSNGYSGIWIANALKETGGKLTTIEFWDKRLNVALDNFKKARLIMV